MNLSIKIFIFLFLLLNAITEVSADTVYLKSGYQMEGIVKRETDEYLELEINLGTVKFYREQIERVEYSSEEEKKSLEQSWQEERLKKESELKTRQHEREIAPNEIEVGRQGNHLYVNALLNGNVNAKLLIDTGASFVVLSPDIAKRLDMGIEGSNPDVKMTLADGREVAAKLFKLDTISIGQVKANSVEAAVIYQENTFQGFDGLLGMSFLKLFKFEINLEKSKLILQKS